MQLLGKKEIIIFVCFQNSGANQKKRKLQLPTALMTNKDLQQFEY